MSYFEDQYEAWMANNCQGAIEDYDGTEFPEVDDSQDADPVSFDFGENIPKSMVGRLTSWDAIRVFIFGGKATFTIRSLKTQARFTYKVTALKGKPKDNLNAVHFVNLLRGPDNESDFAYMGCILDHDVFRTGQKSRVSEKALSMIAWRWLFDRQIKGGEMPSNLEVWHEGRCGRCGRKLTVPESISTGFGPECAGRL